MADKEQKSKGPSAGGSAVVMVEKTSSQRRHKEFRPTALSDDTPVELRHKRSRAPAVPSVAEEYKDLPENADIREQKESILAMPSQKPRRVPSEKSSKREKSPKAIPMTPLGVDVQKSDFVSPAQPIPAPPSVHLVAPTDVADDKDSMDNDDSITEEITDLRVAESSNKEWSDEEAGGLPRSESRASRVSRVSRVWRQLFCCGVPYQAPSEHDISSPRGGDFAGGI